MSRPGNERLQPQLTLMREMEDFIRARGYDLTLPSYLAPQFERVKAEYPQVRTMLFELGEHHNLSLLHTLKVACIVGSHPALSQFPEPRQDLFLAGMVHDAGKRETPQTLLAHPEAPNPAQLRILRNHVEHTNQFCMEARIPRHIARIACAHHRILARTTSEAYGGETPPEHTLEYDQARRLAVADIAEALSGVREYREPAKAQELGPLMLNNSTMSPQEALHIFGAMRPTGFYPHQYIPIAYLSIAK